MGEVSSRDIPFGGEPIPFHREQPPEQFGVYFPY